MHNQQELIIQNPAGMKQKIGKWKLWYPTDIPALVILIYEIKMNILPEYRQTKVGSSESHTTSPAAGIISLVPNTNCIILRIITSTSKF